MTSLPLNIQLRLLLMFSHCSEVFSITKYVFITKSAMVLVILRRFNLCHAMTPMKIKLAITTHQITNNNFDACFPLFRIFNNFLPFSSPFLLFINYFTQGKYKKPKTKQQWCKSVSGCAALRRMYFVPLAYRRRCFPNQKIQHQ